MTDLQRIYQEECAIDHLMDLGEIEEWNRPIVFDDLLPAAIEMLAQEDKGARMSYQMIVVLYESDSLFPTDAGRWKHRAVPAAHANGMTGCYHEVEAASFRYAQSAAVALHKRNCIGRG